MNYLKLRKLWGIILRIISPSYSSCLRCGIPWKVLGYDVKKHVTPYEIGNGCFPLCEYCWKDLKIASARMPYYLKLWEDWSFQAATFMHDMKYYNDLKMMWPKIENSVLEGN